MREQLGSQQGQLDGQRAKLEESQKEYDAKSAELADAEKKLPEQQSEYARKSALLELTSDYRTVSEE